jgi:hypothetical protein
MSLPIGFLRTARYEFDELVVQTIFAAIDSNPEFHWSYL